MKVRTALAAAAALLAVAAPAPAFAQDPPNVVFVLTDDLSSDLIGQMPAVRQLARDGVSFSNYVVSNSLCCPSRASIFTGKYPHNTKVLTNVGDSGGYAGFLTAGNAGSTFGTSLQAAKTRTGFLGKFLNGYKAGSMPPMQGFDTWAASASAYQQFDYVLNEDGTPVRYGRGPKNFLNTVLQRKAQDFIARAAKANEPFALEVSSFTPHAPFTAALQDREKFPNARLSRKGLFDKPNVNAPAWLAQRDALSEDEKTDLDRKYRKRLQAVQSVDRMVAALRQTLVATGEAANTYVVFSSDNGFHLGERRLLSGKQTAFDHDVRVPLIVAGPRVPAGRTTDVLAQNVDLRPTFEAMNLVPVSPDVDGVSLLPWIEQPQLGGGRDAALIEHRREPVKTDDDPDKQTAEAGDPPDYTALRGRNFLYTSYVTGEHEFYDLRTDALQRRNVYDALPARRKQQLEERAQRYRACAGSAQCQTSGKDDSTAPPPVTPPAAPPPAATPAPAPQAAPKLRVGVRRAVGRRALRSARRGLRVRVSSDVATRTRVRLLAGRRVVASRSVALAAGRATTLRLRVTGRRAQRALRRHERLRLQVRAVAAGDGQATTARRTVRLRR